MSFSQIDLNSQGLNPYHTGYSQFQTFQQQPDRRFQQPIQYSANSYQPQYSEQQQVVPKWYMWLPLINTVVLILSLILMVFLIMKHSKA